MIQNNLLNSISVYNNSIQNNNSNGFNIVEKNL